jgi:hypothetical protein
VGTESALLLAIRTIDVSARAAIDSNYKVGRSDMAIEAARRGLAMLEGLRHRIGPGAPEEIRQAFEAAVRELASVAAASADRRAGGVATEAPSAVLPQRGGASARPDRRGDRRSST